MKLIEIKPLERGNTTGANANKTTWNEQTNMGNMSVEPIIPPDVELKLGAITGI